MKMRILGLAAALALCWAAASAEKIAKPGITPVQAELMADLHARLLKVGGTVYARVTVDWKGPGCVLRNGAVLEAHVVSVIPRIKPAKGSEVGLAFAKAQCGQLTMGPFELLLSAVAAPPEKSDRGIFDDNLPVTSLSGATGQNILTSRRVISEFNLQLESQLYRFPLVPRIQMGDVYGIRGLKLSVGTGPENSSILTSKDHDVSLQKHSLFLLVPAQGTFPRASAVSSVDPNMDGRAAGPPPTGASANHIPTVERTAVAPARPPVDDIDLCVPPQCNLTLPSGNANEAAHAAATISIRQLGYAPRPQKERYSFDHDEALAYLGPRELLVAFNPHELVSRQAPMSGSTVRVIRAALVDTETHRVTHTVEWELHDYEQFLWPLAEGRVLVHVGSELRVYGEGLQIQNRVSLDGPLAFVRVTPDGSFMAIGVIHERHTPELHAQLVQNLNGDPEEDVNILVLNRNFETIAKSTALSDVMAPTLLNEGQARLTALPNMRYRISMMSWDNHASILTQFNSSCTPELSSIAPDLIFLVTCEKHNRRREYRVLRSNGKLALKGGSTVNECGHAAESSANRAAFVVKIVQSTQPVPAGAPLRAAQFSSEELHVYRATDGKRLLGVRVGSPSLSRDGYALAPDASQLAILTRDQLAVYSVPR
jgi:hypothetical protein